jgi:hypothetical protein
MGIDQMGGVPPEERVMRKDSDNSEMLQGILENLKSQRGVELKLVEPPANAVEGFKNGDAVVVERSNKTIEKDWKIIGFGEIEKGARKNEIFAICLKSDGTYKALEPSFLSETRQRVKDEDKPKESKLPWAARGKDEIVEEDDVLSYNITILRKPETIEEQNRVLQAKSLLVRGRLNDSEKEFWKGIIQNGGQENPPYKPQLQTQTKRQKI